MKDSFLGQNSAYFHASLEITGHKGPIYSIGVDDQYIYSSAADKFVTRWNMENGKQDDFVIRLKNPSYCIVCSKLTSRVFILDTKGVLYIIDKTTKEILEAFYITQYKIFCAHLSMDEKHLYVSNEAGEILLFDIVKNALLSKKKLSQEKNRKFVLSKDGQRIFIPMGDGKLTVLNVATFEPMEVYSLGTFPLSSIFYDEQQDCAYVGNKNAHLMKFDFNHKEIAWNIPAHNYVLYDILKIGSYGITCSRDKTIKIWNSDFTKVLQRLDRKSGGHKYSVNQLVKIDEFSFASCSDDATIKLFRLGHSC